MFLAFYGFIFALTGLINPKFLPLSFDSGAVVTGPLTIPFILSFGAGIALSRNSASGEDAFGLTALATAGPIVSVMILSLFADPNELNYSTTPSALSQVTTWTEFWPTFGESMIVAIRSSDLLSFLIAKALNALLGLEMEFDPNPFSFFVN